MSERGATPMTTLSRIALRVEHISCVTLRSAMTRALQLDHVFQRHTAQTVLFNAHPLRDVILGLSLPKGDATRVQINVWRNHDFETVSPLIEPYSLFGRWCPSWNLSAYDDTLSFEGWQPAAAELIWLDGGRVASADDSAAWLEQRLQALRMRSLAPIVVATWLPDLHAVCERLAEVYFVDLQRLCEANGVELLDPHARSLSHDAQIVIARELACRALPAVLFPPIKAVAVDLDDTLHAGVLAEDGAQGVELTEDHTAFQQQLKALRARGVYLALVSRNEQSDVEQLFAVRTDYPLRLEDFSAVEVSWDDKAIALQRIAARLRTTLDAVLFIDDNAGELAAMAAELPALHTLHAQPQAAYTHRALSYYPRLWRFRMNRADRLRIADTNANDARAELAARLSDPAEYFRSLQIKLHVSFDPPEQLERLGELSLKTNQFNLALQRWGAAKLREYLARPDTSIAAVQLQDRLSDSGVIAVVCARRQGPKLRVEELCISCRALGRRLEHSIIMLALRGMPIFKGCSHVVFQAAVGPRNQPALHWLEGTLGRAGPIKQGSYEMPVSQVINFELPCGVQVAS